MARRHGRPDGPTSLGDGRLVATTVQGADRLAFTLRRFSAGLDDMGPAHRAAASIALQAARSRAPVRSGRLRASGQTGGTGQYGDVLFTAPYAGPIHWGWPARGIAPTLFATKGAEASQDQWLDAYTNAIQDDLDKVEGV